MVLLPKFVQNHKIMIHCSLLLIASMLMTDISTVDLSTPIPVESVSEMQAEQNVFQVVAWYKSGYQTYKAKLKLKLVSSMYGQNSYMAVEYTNEQMPNGQWLWRTCSASCRYDAINRQFSVFINGITFYFDDPLE